VHATQIQPKGWSEVAETYCDVVPRMGLEPIRSCDRGILSPLCIPFHHLGDWYYHVGIISMICQGIAISKGSVLVDLDSFDSLFS
jgi:hypothetical protein